MSETKTMMIRHVFAATALALFTAAPTMAQPPKQAPSSKIDDVSDRLRVLFRKGAANIAAGKYEEARVQLLEAWSLRKSPDVAVLLGQAELETKHYCDAASHLEYGLANFAPVESEQNLRDVQQTFEEAKSHVGLLRITASRDNALIRVDDRDVGTVPLQGSVFVDPGTHTIEAHSGSDASRRQIVVEAGKQYAAELTLSSERATPSPTIGAAPPLESNKAPAPTTIDHDEQRSVVPIIIGGTVFALGVGAAIGFKLDESAKRDSADSWRATTGPYGCSNPALHANECKALVDASKTIDHDRTWAAVSLVVAGAAAVATPLYWFWPRSASDSPSSVQFRSGLGPHGATVLVSGEF